MIRDICQNQYIGSPPEIQITPFGGFSYQKSVFACVDS